jgi:hypothetical protein
MVMFDVDVGREEDAHDTTSKQKVHSLNYRISSQRQKQLLQSAASRCS